MSRQYQFDFMQKRKVAVICSGILLCVSVLSLFFQWLNLGVDFTGGTLIEVHYEQVAELADVRAQLGQSGFASASVQYFGSANEVLIRIPPVGGAEANKIGDDILRLLSQDGVAVDMRRIEYVGPEVGEELKNNGGLAMLYALFAIFIYIALRFQRWFSVAAVVALIHDVIITIGIFSVFQLDFDLAVLAALLAVIGYSLNDTIVVSDRIRENFRRLASVAPAEVFNISLNQILSRTLMTSLTTLLVLFALLILGGEVIRGFAIALIIGVVIGTYSSIYVVGSVLLYLGIKREDLLPVKVDDES